MRQFLVSLSLLVSLSAAGCGPSGRPGTGGDDGVDAPPATGAEICNDGIDNDGNGRADCSDPACSGVDGCPVCGAVENPEATPLALPDGISSGTMCSTDAQCSGGTPNCVAKECHASYTSTLNFIGFPNQAKLADPNKLLKVCIKAEHSWVRDLQIELITPDGAVFILHKFVDRSGGEIYLGEANDSDTAAMPVAGVGYNYCWTPTATTPEFLTAPTVQWSGHAQLPAGDYKSVAPWTALTGASLNGTWTMRVTDLWGIDNGFLFKWNIAFDPTLVSDCAGPIIL
jgi:hypothetical protein